MTRKRREKMSDKINGLQQLVRLNVLEVAKILQDRKGKTWDDNTIADCREMLESAIFDLDTLNLEIGQQQ
jgi:hypothetical protein